MMTRKRRRESSMPTTTHSCTWAGRAEGTR